MNIKLGDLLADLSKEGTRSLSLDQMNMQVSRVTSDSRAVRDGSVFVAVHGGSQDGHEYIQSAIESGAIAVIGEKEISESIKVPYLRVKDSKKALAQLAAFFYGKPSESLLVIGVTGTSGKTTTTYLLESVLKSAGYQVGLIGTVNFRFGSKIFPSTHTTPGAVELQDLLSQMKAEGCNAVVMEVSSHALKQDRVASIAFDGMIFTNLSPEHLDFHPDMEDYFISKSILFKDLASFSRSKGKSPVAAIQEKDSYGARLLNELSKLRQPGNHGGDLKALAFGSEDGLSVELSGIHGSISGIKIQSQLTGQFNCSNIAGVVKLSQMLGISERYIQDGISQLRGIPGRLERVENRRNIHIWVDYAHKPDALEKVVKTLRDIRGQNRLITVFGCGGDRDRKKRPVMGKIAVEWSDWVIITSDNPRTEDPITIIQEIVVGTQGYSNYQIEPDRKKAIFEAIKTAKEGDLVLIAGKGHEDYQILGKTKIHFDDREVAAEACQSKLT